jgi:hypothetical protein
VDAGDDDGWASATVREGGAADLASIHARLDVRGLYEAATEPAAEE